MLARAIFTEPYTAQVKGAANIMFTVEATQELKPGDFMLRFKPGASQDDKPGSRSMSARLVFGNYCHT